eukprot:scaffold803_cov310-Pinguiococcus_pyrenoidosus.AAC.185
MREGHVSLSPQAPDSLAGSACDYPPRHRPFKVYCAHLGPIEAENPRRQPQRLAQHHRRPKA